MLKNYKQKSFVRFKNLMTRFYKRPMKHFYKKRLMVAPEIWRSWSFIQKETYKLYKKKKLIWNRKLQKYWRVQTKKLRFSKIHHQKEALIKRNCTPLKQKVLLLDKLFFSYDRCQTIKYSSFVRSINNVATQKTQFIEFYWWTWLTNVISSKQRIFSIVKHNKGTFKTHFKVKVKVKQDRCWHLELQILKLNIKSICNLKKNTQTFTVNPQRIKFIQLNIREQSITGNNARSVILIQGYRLFLDTITHALSIYFQKKRNMSIPMSNKLADIHECLVFLKQFEYLYLAQWYLSFCNQYTKNSTCQLELLNNVQSFSFKGLANNSLLILSIKLKNQTTKVMVINLFKYDTIYLQFSNSTANSGFIYNVQPNRQLEKSVVYNQLILKSSRTTRLIKYNKQMLNLHHYWYYLISKEKRTLVMLKSIWMKEFRINNVRSHSLKKRFGMQYEITEIGDDNFYLNLNKVITFYVDQAADWYLLGSNLNQNILFKQGLSQSKLMLLLIYSATMQNSKYNYYICQSKPVFRLDKNKIKEYLIERGELKAYSKDLLRRRYGWANEDTLVRLKWFRKRFKRWFGRFRKITKHYAFSSLLRSYFESLTGYPEKQMLHLWYNFRRSYDNYYGSRSLVQKFSQSLLLVPSKLILFLGFAPSRYAAKAMSQSGSLIINGISTTNLWLFAKPMDVIQLIPQSWEYVKHYYSSHRWTKLQLKLSLVNFLQIDWSMFMITLVRWPYSNEIIAPSFLSERWIRYYIRAFPVRDRKYTKAKMIWRKY